MKLPFINEGIFEPYNSPVERGESFYIYIYIYIYSIDKVMIFYYLVISKKWKENRRNY